MGNKVSHCIFLDVKGSNTLRLHLFDARVRIVDLNLQSGYQ